MSTLFCILAIKWYKIVYVYRFEENTTNNDNNKNNRKKNQDEDKRRECSKPLMEGYV